jgi:hypothetical protein
VITAYIFIIPENLSHSKAIREFIEGVEHPSVKKRAGELGVDR